MSAEPPVFDTEPHRIAYREAGDLGKLRTHVTSYAERAGLPSSRSGLLALAVSELATNTLMYTAGGGTMVLWAEPGEIVCELHDQGPVGGRPAPARMPAADAPSGRGLAIVDQVCDEVRTYHTDKATVVQVRMRL
ncbi:ATP-binding protein [Catellatospora sichuanensis]|uniref:ATP-binding protein n=1 Tax=Catellatospora sichuanensis TaxID=1969805 RepID=UPI001182953F|nr:ATP-binding protein [Catellatospora sichuanensis]